MLSFFPRGVLDEIWNLIESVSEGCPTYSCDIYKYMENDKPQKVQEQMLLHNVCREREKKNNGKQEKIVV